MQVQYDLFRDDLLKRDEICRKFGKSKSWIYGEYKAGLNFMPVGNDRVTSQEDINKHFAKQLEGQK
ncbi:MAG: hypothetical protein VXB01_05585 [Opitutae bacterium]